MKIKIEDYLAKENRKISLGDFKTEDSSSGDKEAGRELLDKYKDEMGILQEKMYAENRSSLLIIFQAMDAAGKDSAIEHVMTGLNPQGCQVYSFKTPNSEDYEHDFLWRHNKALPERGRIGIHNRSHYENVLVCKVHPEYVLNENLPGYDSVKKLEHKFWEHRYESIVNFEEHLVRNGTHILKFFLHVSKDEQKKRFLERIDDPAKNWKFSSGDLKERALWENYQKAYEDAIEKTSTKKAPWYIIPADKKWYARLVISEVIVDTLKQLNLKFPVLDEAETLKLKACKTALLEEK